MKVSKRAYIPVTLTFETEEEFGCFWDAIESSSSLMREKGLDFNNSQYKCLVDISNLFTEL